MLEGSRTVSSCSYGGSALIHAKTQDSGSTSGCQIQIWYLANPSTGLDTFSFNYGENNDPDAVAVISYLGVNQSDPIGADDGAHSSFGKSLSCTLTTTGADSLIVGGATAHGGDTDPFTPGTGITEHWDDATGTSSYYDAGLWGGERIASTSQQYTFSCTSSSSDDWAIACVELKASSPLQKMRDSTSNDNDGTLNGAMTSDDQVSGKISGALDYDGTDDEVDCGNPTSLQLTTVTIEAWCKPDVTGQYMGITGKLVEETYAGYALIKHDANVFRFQVASSNINEIINSDSAYVDTNWHYIVGVHTGTAFYLYVDGAVQTDTGTRAIEDSGDDFRVGRQYATYDDRWWNGMIDEIRISNTARSASWIKASYESEIDDLLDFGSEETA